MTKRRRRQLGQCSYCDAEATTRDNVPPEGMFPDPKPTDLVRVPACRSCNEGRKLDDEYFRWFVATMSPHSPAALSIVQHRIVPRARRKPAFLAELMAKSERVDVYSEGGVYLGRQPGFWYDRPRVQQVYDCIIRGLFRHLYGERLPSGYSVSDFIVNPEIPEWIQAFELGMMGNGVFVYRAHRFEEDPGRSLWFLRFFERLVLLGSTAPTGEITRRQPQMHPTTGLHGVRPIVYVDRWGGLSMRPLTPRRPDGWSGEDPPPVERER